MKMAIVEDKEKDLSRIFDYYSELKTEQKSAYWEVLCNEFHKAIYDYLRNYIYTEENDPQNIFLSAFNDDITNTKQNDNEPYNDNFELFVLQLIENDTKEEDLIPELKKHFNKKIGSRRKKDFWYSLSGGTKIGSKKLRAISKGESKEHFEMHSDYYVDSHGNEKNLLDKEEVVSNSNYNNRKNRNDFSIDEDKNSFESILKDIEELFLKQRVDLRKTLTAIITFELLKIFEAYKSLPMETQIFMLKQYKFYDQRIIDLSESYIQQEKKLKQKDMAAKIEKNTEQISKIRKKFFQEADKSFMIHKRLGKLLLESGK